jgi:hypothetical protein|uniref:Uncharacterized protein n=1 Tax=viral metagenome TaxID=1070528 RepID=A0A6C0BFA7_9ZZZZ
MEIPGIMQEGAKRKIKPVSVKATSIVKKTRKPRDSLGCSSAKKDACGSMSGCVWVPSKGCRIEDNVPLAVLAKIAAKAKTVQAATKVNAEKVKKPRASSGCTGLKKDSCSSNTDCVWVPSKGCRVTDNVPLVDRAKAKKAAKKVTKKVTKKATKKTSA